MHGQGKKGDSNTGNPSFDFAACSVWPSLLEETGYARQQTSIIKTTVQFYVGSFLKVHNPLFSFGNAMFLFVNTIKMLGMLLNLVHLHVHKKTNNKGF